MEGDAITEKEEFLQTVIENIKKEIETVDREWKGHFSKNYSHSWIKC